MYPTCSNQIDNCHHTKNILLILFTTSYHMHNTKIITVWEEFISNITIFLYRIQLCSDNKQTLLSNNSSTYWDRKK